MGMFGKNLKQMREKAGGGMRLPTYYGKHRVSLDRCQMRDGHEGQSTIVEYTILRSDNETAKGKKASWVMNFTKGGTDAINAKEGNLISFVAAVLESAFLQKGDSVDGMERDKYGRLVFEDDDVDGIFGEDQMVEGLEMNVEVIEATSSKGNKFPAYKWEVTAS